MAWGRRAVLTAAAVGLAGCGSTELGGSATPPGSAFSVAAAGDHAVELRYTGIGAQDPARFRVVLSGSAEGTYRLDGVTDDDRWTDDDRYVLDEATLGLDAPLAVDGLTVELHYHDDGDWRTVLRTNPAD